MGETPDLPDVPAFDGGTRYTMAEAARIKGVSYHTVSRAVRSGKLPAQRLGRMALIPAADLQGWRLMRQRAPRKYRKSDPDHENGELPVQAGIGASEGYGDRLVSASERLMVAASAESIAGFGSWLAHWVAHSLNSETAVIWKIDEPRNRVTLYGTYGVDEVHPPVVIESAAARMFRDLSDQEDVMLLDNRTAHRIQAKDWLGAMDGGLPACIPLRSGSRSVGCAIVARRGQRSPLSTEDIAFAQRLGLYAAFAMEHVEMRQANQTSHVTMESVLQGLPVQIVTVDSNGTVVYANRAFTDAWGEEYYERRHYSHLQRSYRVETLDGVEVRLQDNPLTGALRGERVDRAI
ncbi:MAG TPA: helix-turn-helix domain-containing protein [Thermomicrobiales bacterium]|nr:helix-turn-helix domain-containing protein [Thermomicrobiales bacterium]